MKAKQLTLIILKTAAKVLLYFVGVVAAYFLLAFALSVIPVKGEPTGENHTEIFLITNGVHCDLVLPVKSDVKDWSRDVKFEHTQSGDSSYKYIGFGWGDKGFYLETPTWADLTFNTALKAAFGLGPAAIHATFFQGLREGDNCIRLHVSNKQYEKLVSFIEQDFRRDHHGNTLHIKTNANYGPDDAFYDARGRYNIFKTCNTWVNSGLKAAGLKACLWTPFDKTIFWLYQ